MSLSRSNPRAKPRWLVLAGLVAGASLIAGGIAYAVTYPGALNTNDGNLKVEGTEVDWAGVAEERQVDLASGSGDNSFTQGTKEDTAVPVIEFGSIPPNKSDLNTFGIYNEKVSGKNLVHVFWTRVQDPSGTTNMDFEFNQLQCTPNASDPDCSANGVTPTRTVGDILITYDLSRGGTQPTLGYREWNGTAWGDFSDLSAASKATGSINNVLIPSGESDLLGALDPRTFGEATVDLDAIFPPGTTCRAFGSAYLKSRSSDSFTAALKDFIAPKPINVSNCGTLTVEKEAIPEDGQDFSFSVTGPSSYSQPFDLDDDGTASPLDNTKLLTGLFPGVYYVRETTGTVGWDLTAIVCTGTVGTPAYGTGIGAAFDQGAGAGWVTGENVAKVTIAADSAGNCKFTNTGRGTLVIDKVTNPAGDAQTFGFTGTDLPGTADDTFNLADATTPKSISVPIGTYHVAENADPTGWNLTDITCVDPTGDSSDDARTATAVVAAGETVTCTFTNTKNGTLVIDKVTNPAGDAQTFGFTGTDLPGTANDTFNLADATTPKSISVPPGTYNVAEDADPTGWNLTDINCVDPTTNSSDLNRTATAVVAAGETVTCTFTNTKNSTLVIDKVTNPAGDAQSFGFTGTDLPGTADDTFNLADATTPKSISVTPGTYHVAENADPTGWNLTDITCVDPTGDSSDDARTATAVVAAGETVTCTFTNTKNGTLVIDKVTNPAGDAQTFGFTGTDLPGTANDTFNLADATTPKSISVPPGTYNVAEDADPTGWNLTDINCVDPTTNSSDLNRTATAVVAAGETVTCTFTNTKRGSITVKKVMVGGTDTFSYTGDVSGSISTNNGTLGPVSVAPGTYSSTEGAKTGWDLTSISCSDSNSTGSTTTRAATFIVAAGENVTCTFTNTLKFRVIVLVCDLSTSTLHSSDVTFNGVTKQSLTPGSLTPAEQAALCGLGGAVFDPLDANPLPADPYTFNVRIPNRQ